MSIANHKSLLMGHFENYMAIDSNSFSIQIKEIELFYESTLHYRSYCIYGGNK